MTPVQILDAVRTVAHCLDHAPIETLEQANQLVHDHFLEVIERTKRSVEEAAEQRVVGTLWSEIDLALLRRKVPQQQA